MKDILLLHGAIGAAVQLQPLAELLKQEYRVHLINLEGHGGESIPAEAFSMERFAMQVLGYLDKNQINKASIFGYSMGGYVAMQLAKRHPERIEKIITLATKFYWDEEVAAKEVKMLQPDIIEEKLPAFAAELAWRHTPTDWKTLLIKTQELLLNLGKSNSLKLVDYATISVPALIMLGDKDKMVSLPETIDVYQQLPNASLAVLPQTPHPIEKVDPDLLVFYIRRFLS